MITLERHSGSAPALRLPKGMLTWIALLICLGLQPCDISSSEPDPKYFAIHVVDEATGKGIPLVELQTVNQIKYVTDNAGWIAWNEPGLMNTEVFFHVSGPGIELTKDGFGYSGVRAIPTRGGALEIRVKNTNIATRLGRLTGQGLYHHSELLGKSVPVPNRTKGNVLGQDSVQAVVYDKKIFWLWGDTSQPHYPLGNYHVTCATSSLDAHPEDGLVYEYFLDNQDPKRLRKMLPIERPGAMWMFGLFALREPSSDRERLIGGYTRQMGLVPPDERGIAEFDPHVGHFKVAAEVPLDKQWPMPGGHAVHVEEEDGSYVYFCRPFAHVRVRAQATDVLNWQKYEMLRFDEKEQKWKWLTDVEPTTQQDEESLINSGKLPLHLAKYRLKDIHTGKLIHVHGASIQWNEYRNKYVMIALQNALNDPESPSLLGEIWYAESDHISGPWSSAVKVVSHPKYTFYNPIQHGFFNRADGRIIYFEGTYTKEFSGNPNSTPRYDYNQLMYRLDLSDLRLKAAQTSKSDK